MSKKIPQRPKKQSDRILCLVGASGSGKTHISELMEEQGWIVINSYTTRPKRTPDEKHHTFVDQEGFDSIRHDLVAYTFFDGNEYGATLTQVHNSHIYVVDPYGVEVLSKHLGRDNIFVVYLDVTSENCFNRMLHTRGEQAAFERVKHDAHKYGSFSDYDVLLPNNTLTQLSRNEGIISALLESLYKTTDHDDSNDDYFRCATCRDDNMIKKEGIQFCSNCGTGHEITLIDGKYYILGCDLRIDI